MSILRNAIGVPFLSMLFWAGYLAAQTAEEEQSSRSPPRPIEEMRAKIFNPGAAEQCYSGH